MKADVQELAAEFSYANGGFTLNTVEKLFQRLKARSYLRFKRLSLL